MIELVASGGYELRSWTQLSAPKRPVAESSHPAARVDRTAATTPAEDDYPVMSSFRAARVLAIKQEIAEGRFESPERIGGTVARLLDVIA